MKLKQDITKSRMRKAEFEKLVDTHLESLLKHAFFITGSIHDAEDVTQDTFLKFFHQKPALIEASKTKAYLYRMVNNASIDLIRKRKQNEFVELNDELTVSDDQMNGSKNKILLQKEFLRIKKILSIIPEKQSKVIWMRTVSNLSFVEIAQILDIPVTTVKSRFKYGIDKLRKKIGIKKEVYYEL